MADQVLVLDPASAKAYVFNFTPDLPTEDTELKAVGEGSTIAAFNFAGDDVSAAVLTEKIRTGKTLSAVIRALVLGQEYRVRFTGEGATTGQRFTKWLQVLCRNEGEAEL
jgi:hypothetical protein